MNIQLWFPLELTGLISLQSKGLLSLLQHHSLKAPILWCSAFFMVRFSHPYMTTGKAIALTTQTFVVKVMSLPFNMLSRSVITLLPRSKCLLISWLQAPSIEILEPKKIKFVAAPTFPLLFGISELVLTCPRIGFLPGFQEPVSQKLLFGQDVHVVLSYYWWQKSNKRTPAILKVQGQPWRCQGNRIIPAPSTPCRKPLRFIVIHP